MSENENVNFSVESFDFDTQYILSIADEMKLDFCTDHTEAF